MSGSVASTPLMQACALYDAADKIAWMAGEPTEDFVRWLTEDGGLSQMALAFFRAPASSEPSGAARSDWVATLVERVGGWQDEIAAGFEHDPFALLMAAGLLAELAKDPTFTASAEQMRATENAARVPEAMGSGAEAVVREAVGALAEIHEALSRAWSSGILPASVISADLAQRCGALIRKHRLPTAPGALEEGAGE